MTEIQASRGRLRGRMTVLAERIKKWFLRNFAGAEKAVYILSLVVAACIWGIYISDNIWPKQIGTILFSLLMFLVFHLAGWGLTKVLSLLLKRCIKWLLSLGLLCYSVIYVVNSGAGGGYTAPILIFSIGSVLLLQLFAASFWGLWKRRFTPTICLSALCFGTMTVLLGVLVFTDGFDDHYVEKYLSHGGLAGDQKLELEKGPYETAVLDYGTEGAIDAGTVDLTWYMSRSSTDDLTEVYLDQTLEYDLNKVPLVGRIWYPVGEENCPTMFIAHGNHSISADSYLGYEYLGQYLASYGYVVVSVDQNACNLLSHENDGRAVLLLEHMEKVLQLTRVQNSPLRGLIDPDRLVIAGHSRGGEMVATACLFNELDRYPENGNIEFDYHFNIRGIVAIAPTVNQYKPADHEVKLENVNYLLIHGANDQDVTNFQGMSQYENISFTGEKDCLKSAVLIANANHGQFNSLWRDEDRIAPFSSLLNVENFLTQSEQETVAKAFIKAFLDVTLLEDSSHRDLLTNWERYRESLPETVYLQCYETSDFHALADFEEDSDLETATDERVSLLADDASLWLEEQVTYHDGASLDNYGLRLRMDEDGKYKLFLPATDLNGKEIRFDISDYNSAAVETGKAVFLTGTLQIKDRWGNTSEAAIEDYATVWPPLPVRLSKLDYLFGDNEYKYAFTTVSIPAADLTGHADLSNITSISLIFDGPAHLRLDNIGLAG